MTEDTPLISMREVCEMTTLSRAWINQLRSEGRFPEAIPLGPKRFAFVRSDVQAWIRDRISERKAVAK